MSNKQLKTKIIKDFSEYDVSEDGLYNWTDVFFKPIRGVRLTIKLGSDEHLDNLNNLENFLTFY
jgi:hypothetical protein